MNDTIKQQIGRARGAYSAGSLDRATLDNALDIIEKEIADKQSAVSEDGTARQLARPFGNLDPARPAPAASNTPASPQPSTGPHGANPVPEQVGKPFHPGGDVQARRPGDVAGNRP